MINDDHALKSKEYPAIRSAILLYLNGFVPQECKWADLRNRGFYRMKFRRWLLKNKCNGT